MLPLQHRTKAADNRSTDIFRLTTVLASSGNDNLAQEQQICISLLSVHYMRRGSFSPTGHVKRKSGVPTQAQIHSYPRFMKDDASPDQRRGHLKPGGHEAV